MPSRVELRSDTFTLPSAAMLRAMASAELGDDVYGEDPTVNELEALAARTLGKPAACFLPSGTMANLASIMAHCPRGSKVIVGEESDIYVYEAGGAAVCGGVTYHPLPIQADGSLALADIAAAFPADPGDPQFALPALLCLENPQNQAGAKVLPMSYLADAKALAAERGIALHMDGARLFNAALALDVDPAEIAAHADSLQFCLSKGLGAPVGSMAVGEAAFVARVRRLRKMLGGGMRQSGVLAAAAIVALENRARLAEDHATARRLAAGLRRIEGVVVDTDDVSTNMVFFRVVAPGWDNRAFLAACAAGGVGLAELAHDQIRAVTHYGIDDADIDHVLAVIASVLRGATPASPPARESHDHRDFQESALAR
ncbi:low-specificity L-threonine aldolase [Catenulispora subtropica]|uniref:low-specificity L-threonine aldolase n=1 Tax=Catenulispora subtropica TaxID=450798 RepID=UPI0031CDB59B